MNKKEYKKRIKENLIFTSSISIQYWISVYRNWYNHNTNSHSSFDTYDKLEVTLRSFFLDLSKGHIRIFLELKRGLIIS